MCYNFGQWGTIDKIAAMRVAKKLIKGKQALQKEDWNLHRWLKAYQPSRPVIY